MQYKAQVDVIGQLQDKLARLLQQTKSSSSSQKMIAVVKLQRDFERVQARALALQQNVTKMQLTTKPNRTGTTAMSSTTVISKNGAQVDTYQQIQIQLQHDVSLIKTTRNLCGYCAFSTKSL